MRASPLKQGFPHTFPKQLGAVPTLSEIMVSVAEKWEGLSRQEEVIISILLVGKEQYEETAFVASSEFLLE